MDQFDFKFYYNFYPDLQKKNINTPNKLLEHYKLHGIKDNRAKNINDLFEKNNFNVDVYRYNYEDLQHMNDEELKSHYVNYGHYEKRNCFKKIENDIEIKYQIIKKNNNPIFKNNKLLAHLHCYDIDKFNEYFGEYINKIMKHFSVVVTYSIGETIPDLNIYVLKIFNKGMDIGAKFCFTKFINDNNIKYSHCLYLHSKSNKMKRELYFNNILKNLDDTVKNLKEDLGIITFNILINDNEDWGRNSFHMNNIIKYMKLPNYNNMFSEGNIYILHYELSNYMFDNRLNIYKRLNYKNSFDYSWFINYYDCKNLTYEEAHNKYNNEKLYGNNFSTNLGWKGLADCMIEHTFERLPFGVSKLLNKKIKIIDFTDTENLELNDYVFKNIDIYKKPILLIACHTNTEEKKKYLLHNIYKIKDYVDSIYIINSTEYKNIIEPDIQKDDSFIINNNLNDKQANNYLHNFADLLELVKNINNSKKHYIEYGHKEKHRNDSFKKINNYYNIYFEYYDNTILVCQEKWYKTLSKLDKNNNFILTNDSYVIVNDIQPFFNFCKNNKNMEILGLLDSNQGLYHYPDFLRWYSISGIKKWMKYYENNNSKCNNFLDVIQIIEIGSTNITNKKRSLYIMNKDYNKNLHFDDEMNEKYIKGLNYPIIKLKRLNYTIYGNKIGLPTDFDYKIYRELHSDLLQFNKHDLINHFLNHGVNEGRKYKKNQLSTYPDFISNKIKEII